MKLICLFDGSGVGNPYFKVIYNLIFHDLQRKNPEYEFIHQQTTHEEIVNFNTPGGGSNFQIINPKNNKSILMSFWDRGMEVFNLKEWNKYNLIQYIGGLGMYEDSLTIKEKYGVEHLPFQYPLGIAFSYKWIQDFKEDYDPNKKIRKAIFIGAIHGTRGEMFEYMKDHPLIELYDGAIHPYHGREYFKKLSQYALSISFNGTGEWTLRDFESMGLGIPVIRTEPHTQFHNKLIPDYHYIKATEPCSQAWNIHAEIGRGKIAQQYMDKIEKALQDDERLIEISKRGVKYFDSYINVDYIVDLFMELKNLELLK